MSVTPEGLCSNQRPVAKIVAGMRRSISIWRRSRSKPPPHASSVSATILSVPADGRSSTWCTSTGPSPAPTSRARHCNSNAAKRLMISSNARNGLGLSAVLSFCTLHFDRELPFHGASPFHRAILGVPLRHPGITPVGASSRARRLHPLIGRRQAAAQHRASAR